MTGERYQVRACPLPETDPDGSDTLAEFATEADACQYRRHRSHLGLIVVRVDRSGFETRIR